MPRSTDTRILQMQFDNKDFERDIKTSEKTLDRFKEALDFSKCEKGLEGLGNAIKSLSFESVVDNIQKLTDKFTGLGTVSELILSQIRRGIENTARQISGMVDSLAFDTVGEGKDKFEQMNKNVQSIMAATGRSEADVYKVMGRLNKYTDQTSYSFTDMASNIGKFTSVGIGLEDAEKQMEGIANWAARSGAGINEASRAMYNLSQAMGVGKMTKIDWKSIENAGMATKEFKQELIESAVAAGTLVKTTNAKTGKAVYKTAKNLGKEIEVTYMNVADTLSKGWANRKVLENTLARYYYDDLYYTGENAIKMTEEQKEKVDKIFSENDNVDEKSWSTLESIGLATDEVKKKAIEAAIAEGKIVEAGEKGGKKLYKTSKKYGKEISFTMDTIANSLSTGWLDKRVAEQAGLIDGLAKSSYEAAQKCTTLKDVFQAWKDQLSTGWMRAWQNIFGGLSESMELFSAICNKVGDSFSEFIRVLTGDGESVEGILGWWGELGGRESLWSLFVGEYDGMYEGAYGFLDVLKDVGSIISRGIWDLFYTMYQGTLEARGITPDQWFEDERFRTYFLANRFKDAINRVKEFIANIREYFTAIPEGESESRLQKIQKFVSGMISVIGIVFNSISDIFTFIGQLFDKDHLGKTGGLLESFINILEALGLSISHTAGETSKGKGLKVFLDSLLVSLDPLITAINDFAGKISNFITQFLKAGTEGGRFSKIWNGLVTIFSKLFGVIAKIAGPILDFVGNLIDIVNVLFTDGINKQSLKKAGKMLSKAIEQIFGDIFKLFPEYGAKIEKFFSYIFGFADDDASEEADGSGKTIVGVIKKWLRTIFGGTKDFLGDAKKELGNVNLFSIIKEDLGIGLLGKFIGGLSGIVKGTNLYGIIMSFLGGYSLIKLIKLLKQGKGLFSTIGGFFNDLRNKSLKDIIGEKLGFGKKVEDASAKLSSIAKAIALIVGSVAVLCLMPIDNLKRGIIAFGIIAVLIAGLIFVVQKMSQDISHSKRMYKILFSIGTAVLFITIGIALLVKALRPLAGMNIEQIGSMLVGFAGIILILGLFVKYIGNMENVKGAGSLALLAIAIGILVIALKPLASMNIEQLAKMGIGLFAVLYMLREFSNGFTSMKKSGMGSMVMVAISIAILLEALKPLANYSWEGLGKMAAGLVVLMFVLRQFTANSESMKGSHMSSLVMVAISIFILLEALKPLAKYNWEELAKMGAGLVVLMFVLRQFTANSESMKSTGMWQMIAVAAALWILVQALMPLAKFEWGDLAKMGVGLIVLGAVVVLMSRLSKDVSLLKGAGLGVMLLGLAIVIAAFAFLMGSLSNVRWENIAAACVGLIAILVVFALITKQMMMMKAKDITKMIPMFVLLIGLSIVMIAFSVAMNEIRNVDTGKIVGFAAGLSVILLVFAAALKIVSGIPIAAAVKGILVISLGIAALMGVVALLAPLVIGSIGNALAEMGGQLALLSSLIGTFCGRMEGVDEGNIDKGENIILRLKDMITSVIGFVGMKTDISGFTDILFDLGTGLQNFAWHMSQTGDLSGNSAVKLIQDLAGCANDLDTITKLNIDTLTTKITGLGGAMMLYAQGAREVAGEGGIQLDENNIPDVTAAVALMKQISSGLASEDGVVIPENMPSEEQLGLFGAQLAALAGAMIQFEQAGAGLGEGADKALEVIDYFQKLKARLDESQFVTNYNEVTGTFTKEKVDVNSLTTFGNNIEQLGSALGTFAHNTTVINAETGEAEPLNFDPALDTLESFVSLKERLPDTGGLLQFITGSRESLTSLGGEIEAFGQSLADLSNVLIGTDEGGNKKFDPESTKLVSGAIDDMVGMLSVLNENLPRMGLYATNVPFWKALFVDKPKSLTELSTDLAGFGSALNALSHAVCGEDENGKPNFSPVSMDIAKQATIDLVDIMATYSSRLPLLGRYGKKVSAVREFFDGEHTKTISELGDELADFGKSLNSLSKSITGEDEEGNGKFDPDIMPTVKTALGNMTELITYLNSELPNVGGLGQTLSTIWNGRDMNLTDLSGQMTQLGTGLSDFGKALKDGHWDESIGADAALSAVSSLVDIMVKLSNMNSEMQDAGVFTSTLGGFLKNFGTSFDTLYEESRTFFGMSGEDSLATLIVKMMGDIDSAFNKYGDIDANKISMFKSMAEAINSLASINPDADWEKIGIGIADGVESGIVQGTSKVIDTAVKMAVSAYEAAKEALENDTSDPVITPVLNLSNVTDGSKMINGLFNTPYGLSLNGGSLSLDPTQATIYADTSLPKDYTEPINSIRSEVTELRNDLQAMSAAIRQTKFVFNTGAVVAAIGPEMDEYLGRQGYYAVRGEIP